MTPDNALFLLAHRLRNASDLVFKSINEDLRSTALSELPIAAFEKSHREED